MRRLAATLFATLSILLLGVEARAQQRGYCNWCGCNGGPGYRAPPRTAAEQIKGKGRCVSHDELARACGSPPTTQCRYEGNVVGPGQYPPNTELDRGSRSGRSRVPHPAETMQPAQAE